MQRTYLNDLLQLAYDYEMSCHFKFAKTLLRFKNFYSLQKSRDIRKYVEECMKYLRTSSRRSHPTQSIWSYLNGNGLIINIVSGKLMKVKMWIR